MRTHYIIDTRKTERNRRELTNIINDRNKDLPRRYKLERTYRSSIDRVVFQFAHHLNKYLQRSSNLDHRDAISINLNMGQWAEKLDCHKRTAQRHLTKLEEFGFIIKQRIYRGSVRVFVNPLTFDLANEANPTEEIAPLHLKIRRNLNSLFANHAQNLEKQATTENQSVNLCKRTTCHTLYNSEEINTNSLSPTIVSKMNTATIHVPTAEVRQNKLEAWKNLTTLTENQKEISAAAAKRAKQIFKYTNELWDFTYKKLYEPQILRTNKYLKGDKSAPFVGQKLHFLLPDQEVFARNLFVKELQKSSNVYLAAQFHRLKLQLVKWHRFVTRKPGRFTPIPTTFFDMDRATGFKKTLFWIRKDENKREFGTIQNRLSTLLRNLSRAFHEDYPVKDPNNKRKKILRPLTIGEKHDMMGKMIYQKNGLIIRAKNQKKLHPAQLEQLDSFFMSRLEQITTRYAQAS